LTDPTRRDILALSARISPGRGWESNVRSRSRTLSIAAFLLLQACGDSGPSGPTGPTGPSAPTSAQAKSQTSPASEAAEPTLTIVSGETGEPVEASVVVAGVTYLTDANGVVVARGTRIGDSIDVVAASYFDRQTVYRGPTAERLTLWPSTSASGLTPELTKRLVYTGFGEDDVPGVLGLSRPPLGEPVQVYVRADLNDVRVSRVLEDALAALRDAVGTQVSFVVTSTRPAAGVVWQVAIDPDATSSDFIAITNLTFRGYEIVGASLAFRTLADLTDDSRLLMHMMGYAFGLRISPDRNDRMYSDWWERAPSDFSPKEGVIMRLMLQRKAENRFPDSDRFLGAAPLGAGGAVDRIATRSFRRAPR
jgi:hypothetical protein